MADLTELQRKADEAARAYGRGMAEYERGEISAQQLGRLGAKATRARNAHYVAQFAADRLAEKSA